MYMIGHVPNLAVTHVERPSKKYFHEAFLIVQFFIWTNDYLAFLCPQDHLVLPVIVPYYML